MDGYRITDTREVSAMGVDGRFHDEWEITYTTDDGHIGRVRVRKDQANSDLIHTMIQSEVATLNAIKNGPR